ncbi:MAG: 1-(5-phosphoribosyl)-5-[(5-phosphoribosylamino)methylideneamino]imidazole-4-carboxamide isomerase [Ignavibacteriae bacterium]|nr:1-(5-phosphoribosyl)-5-[(5-phosphoribosylamino)methylideneamino]imidazole-4-carboxamide isomerase [Ignavibacteriota bacterium]NOH00259.1 1-(5-phosphoribosyl)-5-[(5-phosphoribosylamino)methylideneamino]imidazole-4-carboxamide isomerase [Ignavibacteriota bacterium]
MKIIPAIDLMNGKVVRLSKGKYDSEIIYNENPVEQAKIFEDAGFKKIHIVDLEGSKVDGSPNLSVVKNIIQECSNVQIQFGGGVRTFENVNTLFDIGVHQIIIGSVSVTSPNTMEEIRKVYDPEKIIIAADISENKIVIKGWTESTKLTLNEHIKNMKALGYNNYLCTDVSKDGMLAGPNIELYENMQIEFSDINIIASGGVSSRNDLVELKKLNLYACVVGKSIYENRITLKELKEIAD